jgi:hypothetical protein
MQYTTAHPLTQAFDVPAKKAAVKAPAKAAVKAKAKSKTKPGVVKSKKAAAAR